MVTAAGPKNTPKIAIIGTGIAGNVAAYRLTRDHDITVFEAGNYIGGHTNTVDVEIAGRHYAVDTGFIVYNNRTYPTFIALLDELGIATQASDMSFSLHNEQTGLEYRGGSINSMFAQRRNLIRPAFYRMIRDILRFNREAPALLEPDAPDLTLGQYLHDNRYSAEFKDDYIMPMGGAIWSSIPQQMQSMPAKFFVRFFANHGLLTVNDHPIWRVIQGGSRQYVERLVSGHRERIQLNTPVRRIKRYPTHVELSLDGGKTQRFDHVFVACHSDQALALLADASNEEREVLGAIPYQTNEAVLHTDIRLMPRRKLAWAAWNYRSLRQATNRVAVTYNMNILQSIEAPDQFCVTLNNTAAINPAAIIDKFSYSHPLFTPAAVAAQRRQAEINGVNRTYYCGAYWRHGFHEDGVVSALNALQHFDQRERHEQRNLRRTG